MASFTLIQSPQDSGLFLVVGPDGLPVVPINEFLLHLSHCGRSAYTLRSYARGLAHFFGWLHTTERHLEDVIPQVIEAYIGSGSLLVRSSSVNEDASLGEERKWRWLPSKKK